MMKPEMGVVPVHLPVMCDEIVSFLCSPEKSRYLDCTAGAGGHSKGILQASSKNSKLLALDIDQAAVLLTKEALKPFSTRATVLKGSYLNSADYVKSLGWSGVDGIVLDLGVSSMQLDQPNRGFSFKFNNPLDMRFDQSSGVTAAQLINSIDENKLATIIWRYGEEKKSRKIARAIINARPLATTDELAEIVRASVGRTSAKIDPATKTFQALRIAVNDELSTLEKALPNLVDLLNRDGRIAIISFHSLEDRLVKQLFKEESQNCICPPEQPVCTCNHQARLKILTIKPLTASNGEKLMNPRSRSAKLRIAQKI